MMRKIEQVACGYELSGAKVTAITLNGESENVRGVKLFKAKYNASKNET